MTGKTELRFRCGDILAILTVAAMIVFSWLLLIPEKNNDEAIVEIYRDGELLVRMPIEDDGEYTVVGEYTNRILIEGGRAYMAESDCPGGDCLHSGSISSIGRSIVCLPNRVEVRINGAPESDEVDFVVG